MDREPTVGSPIFLREPTVSIYRLTIRAILIKRLSKFRNRSAAVALSVRCYACILVLGVHFLLHCKKTEALRSRIRNSCGQRISWTFHDLISDREVSEIIAAYV